jgi:hypothetical protein
MARLSNIAVVVPLPSFDIDPLRNFDEGFFHRAVDSILSEEVSIEESRDETMDETMDDNISISSPYGYDGASDSKSDDHRSKVTKAKSPHFPTPSTTSPAVANKWKSSSGINKNVTVDDINNYDDDILQIQPEEAVEVGSGDKPSAPIDNTRSHEMAIDDNKGTAEDKIFASVDPGKQIEILQFIASHSFMTGQTQPVYRSTRREFTGQVRETAAKAGLDEAGIDALIELVRKTYLEDREIAVAEDAGSAFGEEVDGEEEPRPKSSHRKRTRSSLDHQDNKSKKSKKSQSVKHKRRSHDVVPHDELAEAVEAPVPAEVPAESNAEVSALVEESVHPQDDALDIPKTPTKDTLGSPSTSSLIVDLTQSPPPEEVIAESPHCDQLVAQSPPHDELITDSQTSILQAEDIDAIKAPESPPKEIGQGFTPLNLSAEAGSAHASSVSIPEQTVSREQARSKRRESTKESQKEKNKRKRERRKARKKRASLGGQTERQEESVDTATKEHVVPSTPPKASKTPQSPNESGRRTSLQLPLPADASLWDLDF